MQKLKCELCGGIDFAQTDDELKADSRGKESISC